MSRPDPIPPLLLRQPYPCRPATFSQCRIRYWSCLPRHHASWDRCWTFGINCNFVDDLVRYSSSQATRRTLNYCLDVKPFGSMACRKYCTCSLCAPRTVVARSACVFPIFCRLVLLLRVFGRSRSRSSRIWSVMPLESLLTTLLATGS